MARRELKGENEVHMNNISKIPKVTKWVASIGYVFSNDSHLKLGSEYD